MPCTGSVALCRDLGVQDKGSAYADEGTAAHAIGAGRLTNDPMCPAPRDKETSDYVDVYVDAVRNAAAGKILLVEQRVGLERWTGEKGGKGTSDAIIVDTDASMVEVWDLKFGMGHLVEARDNKQLMLYALGALDMVEMVYGQMKRVKLVICQPRRDHLSSHTICRDDLLTFGKEARDCGTAALALLLPENKDLIAESLHPSESTCLWCPAKAVCPALSKLVQDTVFEEFSVVENNEVRAVAKTIEGQDVPSDGVLNLITDWAKAKREWIDAGLRAGRAMPGWKLVLGKKGNRKFTDIPAIEKLLKSLKLKKEQTHETSLLPLTKLEKMIPKPKWEVFKNFIAQSNPLPIAVSASDERPEYSLTSGADGFDNVEVKQEDNFDAFR